MLVELATRVQGSSMDDWLEGPYAFALWTYRHLQEIDRRRDWVKRMQRIESGHLTGLAFHEPAKIAHEHRAAIAEAGPELAPEDLLAIGRQIARDVDAGGVLQ